MKLQYRNEKTAKFIAQQYNKPLDQPDWYKIEASADGEGQDILIYNYVGWPYNDAGDFVRQMMDIQKGKITIRINSQGGDWFDGVAIYNAIKAHPLKPVTRIESLAASAAHYISLAGSQRQAYKNSMIMMHRPLTVTVGNEDDHEETLGVLRQIGGIMVDSYADDSGLGKKEIAALLKGDGKKDGTWMTAKQAKEKGFIDTIIEAGKPVKAEFDLSIFASLPDEFKADNGDDSSDKKEPDIRSIEKILRDVGGLSKNRAKAVLARGWNADAIDGQSTDTIDAIASEIKKTIAILKGK